ncbi:myb/SANT-like DNA-binding domain-containing protein 4 [Drosophila gunungcola]|uniref:myb/SANT-like DNA-binding domain-containing protein 4 n=1 Tax=Drosophila gunungcola TaxID=103775 RepID=UPI0022DEB81D|nr:myb/SANT-like DNA-binding domain-containing protein 4 [Drosophila gunungcola]
MSSKRIRGKNFSEQEEHALIDLVLLNKDILQDKKKDAATWRKKAETWERLAKEFRTQTGTDRSWTALREKYDNMKKNSRNKLRGVKNWDAEKELSESFVPTGTTTTPLENQFDSDGNFQLINVAKEEDPSISSHNSDSSQLLQFFKQNMDDFEEPEVDSFEDSRRWNQNILRNGNSTRLLEIKRNTRIEEEQVELIKVQQEYYRDQNSRAAEKHKYEVEKQIVELQTARLKNQLLEMEIEVKREELYKSKQSIVS